MNIPRRDMPPAFRRGVPSGHGSDGALAPLPIVADDMPVMYEDEGQEDMGESTPHTHSIDILFYGLMAHLAPRRRYRVLSNLDLYYHPRKRRAYVSPDIMVVTPAVPGQEYSSYRIDEDGPAPVFVLEVLSARTHQQQDLTKKPIIYAKLGIREYGLVDVTGLYLPQRLLIKQLRTDRNWSDGQDADGGITSRLGFRVVIEEDGQVRVVNRRTGEGYVRPDDAMEAVRRVRALEEELARLRGAQPKGKPREKKQKGRRRKS